ncbi:hypothetical protein M5K25_000348 [Dendrobium thyrsiflorum]|uniref:Hyaluronan/mRNA-binding protein domain-containing protein n=1 Tax=Dendrobium thyrsiflorum TaxID=117978 RepID=A0ABD0VTD1_DENTH
MARQDNPFALLGDDDDGADVSVLLAKVEAKMPAVTPPATEQTKQKTGPNGLTSKLSAPGEFVRGERGRGRGGRGRGLGRGGFGNVGGGDAIDQPEHLYDRGYSGESGGERSRGRGGRGGMGRGRGRGFTGIGNRNQVDYGNPEDGREEGGEFQEKGYGESRPSRYDSRKFGEENQGPDGEERENRGFRGYGADRENRGLRGQGSDLERREFRDGEGYERKREFRDGEGYERKREFKDGEGYERSYGGDGENRGFRGGEGRGRGYGGRGRRGGRDVGRGGGRYESDGGWNASETNKASADEKEATVNNTNNEDGGSGRDEPSATQAPNDGQSEKPIPEQIASEDTSKVPEEDNEMTLAEYEKLLQEKRKALESLKVETRKVVIDKDFEGMQIIEKKKEDEVSKLKLDYDKGKKKEITEREEKSRKSQSINEFLKPADGERYRVSTSSRGRGGRGRGRGGGYVSDYPSQAAATAPPLEDPTHFPILGAAAKA